MSIDGAARVPDIVADDEPLHRRIHPSQIKEDGSASSGAFTDDHMSVDRANYRSVAESLANHPGMGIAQLMTHAARQCTQDVVACKELLNRAHAEVRGKKTKAIKKQLARSSKIVHPPSGALAVRQDSERAEEPPAEILE